MKTFALVMIMTLSGNHFNLVQHMSHDVCVKRMDRLVLEGVIYIDKEHVLFMGQDSVLLGCVEEPSVDG